MLHASNAATATPRVHGHLRRPLGSAFSSLVIFCPNVISILAQLVVLRCCASGDACRMRGDPASNQSGEDMRLGLVALPGPIPRSEPWEVTCAPRRPFSVAPSRDLRRYAASATDSCTGDPP